MVSVCWICDGNTVEANELGMPQEVGMVPTCTNFANQSRSELIQEYMDPKEENNHSPRKIAY